MNRFLRSLLVTVINSSLIFLPMYNATAVNAAEALALPAGDLIAPEIKSPQINTKVAPGESIIVNATVTDNVGVRSVTLFYRNTGATDFQRVEMSREQVTDNYAVILPEVIEPGVEYYIQATDLVGNTVLHGHTFSPLTISVSSGSAPQAETEEAIALVPEMVEGDNAAAAVPAKKGVSKWVWIGLGVLAVGAAASGGGGGGDPTGGGDGGGDPTVGTITITGPTP